MIEIKIKIDFFRANQIAKRNADCTKRSLLITQCVQTIKTMLNCSLVCYENLAHTRHWQLHRSQPVSPVNESKCQCQRTWENTTGYDCFLHSIDPDLEEEFFLRAQMTFSRIIFCLMVY